jgi:hypothetical protein
VPSLCCVLQQSALEDADIRCTQLLPRMLGCPQLPAGPLRSLLCSLIQGTGCRLRAHDDGVWPLSGKRLEEDWWNS